MTKKKSLLLLLGTILLVLAATAYLYRAKSNSAILRQTSTPNTKSQATDTNPLSIVQMRSRAYLGSQIQLEQQLAPGPNYDRFIASYLSDGLKIYGLLTIPTTATPSGGFPAIDFIHGHLDPQTYTPTERYVAYQGDIAAAGYVTFKPDLRGHGHSQGQAVNSNFSPDYVTDALNAKSALQKMPQVNAGKIGIWGHSMGGGIALRSIVISGDFKAAVIWAGVVGDYDDLLERYRQRIPWLRSPQSFGSSSGTLSIIDQYGSPSANSQFWQSIDPYTYLSDITTPVQLHHGTADDNVPIEFSRHLRDALLASGKTVEEYEYPGSDHNIAQGFPTAMQRTIAFFNKYLK